MPCSLLIPPVIDHEGSISSICGYVSISYFCGGGSELYLLFFCLFSLTGSYSFVCLVMAHYLVC